MDHYKTLGIAKTATPDEIKKSYRKLASQHHPDKGGDTATFQKIQTAYDILGDQAKRQEYDNPSPQFNGAGFPGGFDFGQGPGFHDMFAQMFKQHTGQRHQPQHQSYRTSIWVTLDQVFHGGEQALKLQTPTGTHAITIGIPKGVTDGAQVRSENVLDGASLIVEFRIHPHLKYTRKVNDLEFNHSVSVLDLIAGTSFVFTTLSGKTLEVTIPPKTQPYMQLKLAGQGMPIANSNSYGDQIILLKPFIPAIIDESIINSILQARTK
jgi:DnaJ-class molecular chaperone